MADTSLFLIIVTSIAWGYIIMRFMDIMYVRKYTDRIAYAGAGVFYVVSSVLANLTGVPVMNTIVSYVVFMGICIILYERKRFSFLLYNTYFMIYIFFLDVFVIVVMSLIMPMSFEEITSTSGVMNIAGIAVILTGLATYGIIAKIFLRQKITKVNLFENILVLVFIFFELVIISMLIILLGNRDMGGWILIVTFGFLLMNAAQIYLFNYVSSMHEYEQKMSLYDQQTNLMNQFYSEAEEKYVRSQKILHDIRRHMNIVQELFREGDREQAEAYLESVENKIGDFDRFYYFRNRVLNLLINEKYNLCLSKRIPIEVHVRNLELDYLEDFDITTILGNLFDNAIDACCDMEAGSEAAIEIRLHEFGRFLMLSIVNTMEKAPKREREILKTTKAGHQGIGLMNVKETVRKYGGEMKIDYTEHTFSVKIMIPIPENC